jgi:hypothetical protein
MWLYPLPAVAALVGSVFILTARVKAKEQLWAALIVAATGTAAYGMRAYVRGGWPFGVRGES